MNKRLLAVGDSTEIEIIFSAGSRRGRFSKSPRLYTSDPSVTETKLRLKGEIIDKGDPMLNALMNFEPFGLEVIMGEADIKGQNVKVTNVSDENLSMKIVSNSPSYLDVSLPKGDVKPGESAIIKVKLVNPDSHGTQGFTKSFTIELSDSAKTRFTLPVTYHDQQQASVQAKANQPRAGQTTLKPSGLETKTGNTIHVIEAGTNKSNVVKGD
ncbi:MAG: DUF1573 domain-containing protein [candidate division Zixibacteria bacterium]|nr:DUF1573 domain-containing protein [candidate division Zixibacteria bacterium]NIR63508.1 DUF1573 domain-containing protein [candidate division Zixibacteria bacterium]NIS16242.1 DUF1573 domain-containing protein [candidate division Zixibacteria bacterium]NIS45461.1 DUF1573 domain-containing protein [candidate division Zixibacteria bacterium]NIT52632.1 DUF1573 domain-containing protein [candidate division Zixibacteria bacterium]